MPDATAQNTPKATRVRASGVAWVRTPAAPGAANTSRFLGHCRSRAVRTMASRTDDERGPELLVAGSSGSTLLTARMLPGRPAGSVHPPHGSRPGHVLSPRYGRREGSMSTRRGLAWSRADSTGVAIPQSAPISGSFQATPSSSAGL